jgi:Ser/Thr protein kinase RdoA (MazF antagonist)
LDYGEAVMTDTLTEALRLYPLKQPEAELIRHNENMTYKIADGDSRYVLRIHKPVEGLSLDMLGTVNTKTELIRNELAILSALRQSTAVSLQKPAAGLDGEALQSLADGTPVTLLSWVDGQTFRKAERTNGLLYSCGVLMAEMHAFFAQPSEMAAAYERYYYDQSLLPAIANRIEQAVQNGVLTKEHEQTIQRALNEMRRRFDELDAAHRKQIVHADMSDENIIVGTDGRLTPIDFSLCGYSHVYFDISYVFGLDGHDDVKRRHFIEGYKSVSGFEPSVRYIEPYLALGVLLFITGQYERAKDWDWFPGAMERWHRDTFTPLAKDIPFLTIPV